MRTKTLLGSLLLLLLLLLAALFHWTRAEDPRLTEARSHYLQAERASSIAERTAEFNASLRLLLELEKKYQPRFGTGRLYFAIGNNLFQLGSYPEAILYYRKAHKLMPRAKEVLENQLLAEKKLSLAPAQPTNSLRDLLSSLFILSLPERLQLFFVLSLGLLLIVSFSLWRNKPSKSARVWGTLIACCLAVIGLSLLYTHFFAPTEGVMVESAFMRKDAGTEYSKVGDTPLPAGAIVELMTISPDGAWFKVLTPKGTFGYVQGKAIRIVDVE